MKSMKIMLPALLLSLSLGAFAQDDDELLDATSADEAPEVFVAAHPWEKPIFHRVQIGYTGTVAKYNTNSPKNYNPSKENYFLSGLNFGWMCDLILTKNKLPLFLETGASMTWQTGSSSRGPIGNRYPTTGGALNDFQTRVQVLSLTIPVTVNYQFRRFMGVDDLTLAPFVGPYFRFNLVAKRKQTRTETVYDKYDEVAGVYPVNEVNVTVENKSLKEDNTNGNNGWMEGRNHRGKLLQAGVQIGANAFYKHYSFGLAYMYDITPFAKVSSPNTSSGTGIEMEITTRHNVFVSVGYIF